jgi:hypothetical protein
MIEALIRTLISFAFLVLVFVLIEWVLAALGFGIPATVLLVLKVIMILVGVLILYRALKPHVGGYLP